MAGRLGALKSKAIVEQTVANLGLMAEGEGRDAEFSLTDPLILGDLVLTKTALG